TVYKFDNETVINVSDLTDKQVKQLLKKHGLDTNVSDKEARELLKNYCEGTFAEATVDRSRQTTTTTKPNSINNKDESEDEELEHIFRANKKTANPSAPLNGRDKV